MVRSKSNRLSAEPHISSERPLSRPDSRRDGTTFKHRTKDMNPTPPANAEATEAVAKPVPDAFVSGLNLNTSETRYNHVHVMRRGGDRYLCGRKASPIEFRSKEQATCIRCVAALKKQLKQ